MENSRRGGGAGKQTLKKKKKKKKLPSKFATKVYVHITYLKGAFRQLP